MIETREQYELIARQVFGGRDWDALNKTIESLREVVIAADDIDLEYDMRQGMWIMNGEPHQAEALHDALDKIPDWLKRND